MVVINISITLSLKPDAQQEQIESWIEEASAYDLRVFSEPDMGEFCAEGLGAIQTLKFVPSLVFFRANTHLSKA